MDLDNISKAIENQSITQQLIKLSALYPSKIVFSTSFGLEDQVISHQILVNQIPINIFTLDTGRLFPETLQVWQETEKKYATKIKAFLPEKTQVDELVAKKGLFSFYESIENRKECCHIRKVVPLNQALACNKIWITGIRAEQSVNRLEMKQLEEDEAHQLVKFHPLLHWTLEEVKNFIKENKIPYNSLHDKGFPSIGCEPCTRAIKAGEDVRAGRWWWEQSSGKECGLHDLKKA